MPNAPISINVSFLAITSLPIYLLSLAVTLTATFFDMLVATYDPHKEDRQEQSDLQSEFRKLKE